MSEAPDRDEIDRALHELEQELRSLGAHVSRGEPPEPRVSSRVRWDVVYEWCRRHPGDGWSIDGVYINAAYRLRKRHPDLTVTTQGSRKDATGRRVTTMWCVYDPPVPDYKPPEGG